ncbi:MAG: transcriptional repressor LexA [Balneolales bacterium]|nr:transcriptional repressor LexA [Balneolales bacterium]
MDNKQLTKKQKEFFEYISDYYHEHDIWPTYREIAEQFGFKSPNSVTQNLQALVKKGVLIKSEDNEYSLAEENDENSRNIDEGIPVRGIIAAGLLQEAVEANLGVITLKHLFPKIDKMYALRVSGYSMREAGVMDGDFVLLMDDDVKDGDIGAVLFNGETSLKRIYYGPNGLRLEPANDSYKDIFIEPDIFEEVKILGKYIGHVNRSGIYREKPN